MDPLSKIELFFAKWGLYLIIGAVVALLVIGWLGYNSWRNSQNADKIATANRTASDANTKAGASAVNTLQNNQDKNNETDAKLPPIINNYNSYPAAKVGVDPAFLTAFDNSLCVYRSAANLPQCAAVQQVAPK